MINISVTKEIKNKAKLILEKVNLGNRGIADGNYEEQKVGLIGQLIIHDLYQVGHSKFEDNKFDGGFDIIINNQKCEQNQLITQNPCIVNMLMAVYLDGCVSVRLSMHEQNHI